MTKLPSNSKRKAKRLGLYIVFMFAISQPLVPCAAAAMMPLPPAIQRLSPIEQDRILSNENYYPQIAHILEEKVDKIRLTDDQIKELNNLALQLNSGSITMEEAVLQFRGGDGLTDVSAVLAFVIFINKVQGFHPVQPVHHYPPRIGEWGNVNNGGPPHVGGYGKGTGPRSITVTGATNSGSERNLIQNAYSQIPNISVEGTDFEITAWSVAKHAHHGPDFGLDPTKYGMTQSDLDSIAANGLINHIKQGGTPPNARYVKALQKRWKAFAEHKKVRDCGIQPVMGKDCQVFKHRPTRIFLSFDSESGESFTGYKLSKGQYRNHYKYGIIGKNYEN